MTNLLTDNKTWIGEFFVPDQYEKRFAGRVEYTPESGVILEYSITTAGFAKNTKILHGLLSEGGKCTLIGDFHIDRGGHTVSKNLLTYHGKAGFSCLLIGDWIAYDEKFYELIFSLQPMQEFFFPKGFKSMEKHSDKPLVSVKAPYGSVKVGTNSSFGFLPDDITAQIYSRDKVALKKLKTSFEKIRTQHPNAHFVLKKDINYRISMTIDAGLTTLTAYNHIADIANLFALLIYSPVYPDSISILKKVDDELLLPITLFPSLVLNKRSIELCMHDRFHPNMPIRKSNIDLAAVLNNWLSSSKGYSTIIAEMIIGGIQHETGFRNANIVHGEIVLYATQLELIANEDKIQKKKYEAPILAYSSAMVQNSIKKLFLSVGEKDIGKAISSLRGEIAHAGSKPIKLSAALSLEAKVKIAQCMHLTILGYLLKRLGIANDVVDKYQNLFCPPV